MSRALDALMGGGAPQMGGMLSAPMSPIFGLMTRFIRTLGDTRSEPLNIATKTLVTAISSCLKPACAGSSARNLPRGPLVAPAAP